MFHNNRFNRMIIMQTKQEFHRAILGLKLRNLLKGYEFKLLCELLAQRLGEIGHFAKIINTFHINPVKDLTAAKRRFPVFHSPLLQLLQEKSYIKGFILFSTPIPFSFHLHFFCFPSFYCIRPILSQTALYIHVYPGDSFFMHYNISLLHSHPDIISKTSNLESPLTKKSAEGFLGGLPRALLNV